VRDLLEWLIDHAEARDEERAAARELLDQAHPAGEAATGSEAQAGDGSGAQSPPAPDVPPAPAPEGQWPVAPLGGGSQP